MNKMVRGGGQTFSSETEDVRLKHNLNLGVDDQQETPPYKGMPLQTEEDRQNSGGLPVENRSSSRGGGDNKQGGQRTIGLNPLQENATLRLLTYEA